MTKIITISKARQKLLELAGKAGNLNDSFIITRDSEPISALIPFDEYESLLETLDILKTEPDILRKLKRSEKEMAEGRFKVWKPRPAARSAKTSARMKKRAAV